MCDTQRAAKNALIVDEIMARYEVDERLRGAFIELVETMRAVMALHAEVQRKTDAVANELRALISGDKRQLGVFMAITAGIRKEQHE